jgi:predicted transcriptional regulator
MHSPTFGEREMKVSNPLTIIAIFSGVAETLATVALVQLPLEIQEKFVYFVMAFPSGIVLLFFLVLYLKNNVLYAPSDYDDQTHYLEANNLKEKVRDQLEVVFKEINSQGNRLTREEVDKAKRTISETITRETISDRQRAIIDFITDNPSELREIAQHFGLSMNLVKYHLQHLEKHGLAKRDSDRLIDNRQVSVWRSIA